jgi:hydroxymethylpyrimidine/phosphomethylpyrimidine kinase
MVAKGGHRLLEPDAVEALTRRLLPLAAVLTPNLPEAEALAGVEVRDEAGMARAADALLGLGARAVLLKGGHLAGERVVDLLVTRADRTLRGRAHRNRPHHGTGCTLASAVAAGLAQAWRCARPWRGRASTCAPP